MERTGWALKNVNSDQTTNTDNRASSIANAWQTCLLSQHFQYHSEITHERRLRMTFKVFYICKSNQFEDWQPSVSMSISCARMMAWSSVRDCQCCGEHLPSRKSSRLYFSIESLSYVAFEELESPIFVKFTCYSDTAINKNSNNYVIPDDEAGRAISHLNHYRSSEWNRRICVSFVLAIRVVTYRK